MCGIRRCSRGRRELGLREAGKVAAGSAPVLARLSSSCAICSDHRVKTSPLAQRCCVRGANRCEEADSNSGLEAFARKPMKSRCAARCSPHCWSSPPSPRPPPPRSLPPSRPPRAPSRTPRCALSRRSRPPLQSLEALGHDVRCAVDVPRRRRDAVNEVKSNLHFAQTIAGFTRAVGPVLTQASHDLHAVETADPALKSGRTAWRRLRRTYAGFAELPKANVCSQVRAYVRNGYRHTPETRRTMRAFHAMMAWDTADMDRACRTPSGAWSRWASPPPRPRPSPASSAETAAPGRTSAG